VLGLLARIDRAASATRLGWVWLGQLGLIALGVHLGADRLDDALHAALVSAPVPWPTVEAPATIAAWTALVLELLALTKATAAVLWTSHAPQLSWRRWWDARSAESLILTMFWAPTALAGAWVLGMAAEDLAAPWVNNQLAFASGVALATFAAWRLGLTGLVRVIGALEPTERKLSGWWWAPVLLPLAALAARHGLPLWWLT
jgi:hypothetical protein